jgi:hypothetical protein
LLKISVTLKQQRLTFPKLPLAVYREVASHLRQVKGVNVDLIPQTSLEFDYLQSQVGGIVIEYETDISPDEEEKIKQILAYYGDKYSPFVIN